MEVNGTPTPEGYEWFSSVIKTEYFQEIDSDQIRKDYLSLGIKRKIRKIEGFETGFIYASPYSDYKVIIWTTWLKSEQKLRDVDTDAGWVLIVLGKKAVYFARPFLRSNKNFFLSLFRYAWISKWKIDHVPLCPCENCLGYMKITRRNSSRRYFWKCTNKEKHDKPTSLFWDYGVPPKALDFLKIRRENTVKYNQKNQKAFEETGKPIPTPKAVTRKVRKVGRPDNLKE